MTASSRFQVSNVQFQLAYSQFDDLYPAYLACDFEPLLLSQVSNDLSQFFLSSNSIFIWSISIVNFLFVSNNLSMQIWSEWAVIITPHLAHLRNGLTRHSFSRWASNSSISDHRLAIHFRENRIWFSILFNKLVTILGELFNWFWVKGLRSLGQVLLSFNHSNNTLITIGLSATLGKCRLNYNFQTNTTNEFLQIFRRHTNYPCAVIPCHF